MNARWMPVLAALVGVLGGVGGAIAGGAVANSGQEQGFQREREAQVQDLRIATYARYLGAADAFVIQWGIAGTKFSTDEEEEKLDFVKQQLDEFFRAGAAVELLANARVRNATVTLRERLTEADSEEYDRLRNSFIRLAQNEIG